MDISSSHLRERFRCKTKDDNVIFVKKQIQHPWDRLWHKTKDDNVVFVKNNLNILAIDLNKNQTTSGLKPNHWEKYHLTHCSTQKTNQHHVKIKLSIK